MAKRKNKTIKDLNYYMGLSYRVEVIEDKIEGGYALHCPDLPGCITCAQTINEAFENIEDAKHEWFSACLEGGIAIPEPRNLRRYSGIIELKIPLSLHKKLAETAEEEGVSLETYCRHLLTIGVAQR